jgi:hypothetical protein
MKKPLNLFNNTYRWINEPKYIFLNIKYLIKDVKHFFQRGWRGYADCDVWSFDNYIAKVFIGGLKQLNTDSCPINLTSKKWKEIVKKIRNNFIEMEKFHGYKVTEKEMSYEDQYKRFKKINKETFELLGKYYWDLWD